MTAGVGAAAALAALPLIQQLFSVERPEFRTKVLLVVGSALVALALDRLRAAVGARSAHADLEARLKRALRAWPLPALQDAEPHHLGVFPAGRAYSGSEGAAERFVNREAYAEVERAIARSFLVLLYGPRLAGKSRAAFEAARRAVPTAAVAAPEDGEALLELLEPDSPLRSESRRVVLWLDGLERFVDSIDGAVLDEFQAMECGVTAIATVRTNEWEELLRASGQNGEAAKAIAARARAFAIEPHLEPGEREVARRLFPGADLEQGIGLGVAASGKDSAEPVMPASPSGPDEDGAPGPALLAPSFLVSVLLALIVFGAIPVLGASKPAPPTLSDRIAAIKHGLSSGTRDIAATHLVDFHGAGAKSYLFSIQDRGRSHELVVYDVKGADAVRRFDFRPKVNGATFHFVSDKDVNDDGAAEVVGAYQVPRSREELVPFMLQWDDHANHYRLVALGGIRTSLSRPAAPPYRAAYRRSMTFVDAHSRIELSGYPVQDFGVTGKPYRLVAAYYVRTPHRSDPGQIEVHGSIFATASFAQSHGPLTPCKIPEREPILRTPDPARTIGHNALDAWSKATRDGRDCAPVIARH